MTGTTEANRMLEMARKDLRALGGKMEAKVFGYEIFGFHAQQAVEKAMKAWLARRDFAYPHTHDLSVLLDLLEENGEDCRDYSDLIGYSSFAVQYRYEPYQAAEEIYDRSSILARVTELIAHVERLINESSHASGH